MRLQGAPALSAHIDGKSWQRRGCTWRATRGRSCYLPLRAAFRILNVAVHAGAPRLLSVGVQQSGNARRAQDDFWRMSSKVVGASGSGSRSLSMWRRQSGQAPCRSQDPRPGPRSGLSTTSLVLVLVLAARRWLACQTVVFLTHSSCTVQVYTLCSHHNFYSCRCS